MKHETKLKHNITPFSRTTPMVFSSPHPTLILPLCLLPLHHLYLPLLSCYNCLLDTVQHISGLQAVRGTLKKGTGFPHSILDAVDVTLQDSDEGTGLAVLVDLCGQGLVVDIFESSIKQCCLISVVTKSVEIVS